MAADDNLSVDTDGTVEPMAVTVVGGYLGAGKTTLVNHILRTADQRVAVLVNDFGDINIDAELIERADGDTISLANGCICCSLVDGLASALNTIKEIEPRPERLVIEASGVADPATVAAYGHSPGLRLDAVVVVTDAETVRSRSTDRYVGDTVLGQLRSADIMVLNKADLVDEAELRSTRDWLAGQAPDAVIVESTQARVPTPILFGFDPTAKADGPGSNRPAGGHSPDPAGHSPEPAEHSPEPAEHSPERAGHSHGDAVFESWSWSDDRPMARERIGRLMAELPESVVRAKGVVWLDDRPDRRMILQRVGRRWSLRPGGAWLGPPASQIVAIGVIGAIDDNWLAERLAV